MCQKSFSIFNRQGMGRQTMFCFDSYFSIAEAFGRRLKFNRCSFICHCAAAAEWLIAASDASVTLIVAR
jgi:hypothetical protein